MRKQLKRQLQVTAELPSMICDGCENICEVKVQDSGRHITLQSQEDGWGVLGIRVGDGLRDLCPECLSFLLAKLKDRQTSRAPYFSEQLEGEEA